MHGHWTAVRQATPAKAKTAAIRASGLTLEPVENGMKLDPRQEFFCGDGTPSTCANLQRRKAEISGKYSVNPTGETG